MKAIIPGSCILSVTCSSQGFRPLLAPPPPTAGLHPTCSRSGSNLISTKKPWRLSYSGLPHASGFWGYATHGLVYLPSSPVSQQATLSLSYVHPSPTCSPHSQPFCLRTFVAGEVREAWSPDLHARQTGSAQELLPKEAARNQ